MYGKIIDGRLIEAPGELSCELEIKGNMMSYVYFDPMPQQYRDAGFLPVMTEVHPADGEYYTLTYTERDGGIYGEWIKSEPPKQEPTLEERVSECEDALVELAEIITEGV